MKKVLAGLMLLAAFTSAQAYDRFFTIAVSQHATDFEYEAGGVEGEFDIDELDVGIEIGWAFDEANHFALTANVQNMDNDIDEAYMVGVDYKQIFYNIYAIGQVRPFIGAQAGLIYQDGPDAYPYGAYAGPQVGFYFEINPKVAFEAHYKYNFISATDDDRFGNTLDITNNSIAGIGIQFRF